MTNREPSEISEARKLLREFERNEHHSERVSQFEEALDLLESYLSEQDNPELGRVASNLRRTYTRKLLEQLHTLHTLDIDDWGSYSMLLLTKLHKEVDAICAEEKTLEKELNAFIAIWANEAIELLQKHLVKT